MNGRSLLAKLFSGLCLALTFFCFTGHALAQFTYFQTVEFKCEIGYFNKDLKSLSNPLAKQCVASVHFAHAKKERELIMPISCIVKKGSNFCTVKRTIEVPKDDFNSVQAYTEPTKNAYDLAHSCISALGAPTVNLDQISAVSGLSEDGVTGSAGLVYEFSTKQIFACAN